MQFACVNACVFSVCILSVYFSCVHVVVCKCTHFIIFWPTWPLIRSRDVLKRLDSLGFKTDVDSCPLTQKLTVSEVVRRQICILWLRNVHEMYIMYFKVEWREWIHSDLSGCAHFIQLYIPTAPCRFWGGLSFTNFLHPLGKVIFNIQFCCFADDTPFYVSSKLRW